MLVLVTFTSVAALSWLCSASKTLLDRRLGLFSADNSRISIGGGRSPNILVLMFWYAPE